MLARSSNVHARVSLALRATQISFCKRNFSITKKDAPDQQSQSLTSWLQRIQCGDMHYTLFHKLQFQSLEDLTDMTEREIVELVEHEAMKTSYQPGALKRLKRNLRSLRTEPEDNFIVISEQDQKAIKMLRDKHTDLKSARQSYEDLLTKLDSNTETAQVVQRAAFEKAENLLLQRKEEALRNITDFQAHKRQFIHMKLNHIEEAEATIDIVEDRIRELFKSPISDREKQVPQMIAEAKEDVDNALKTCDITLDAPLGFRSDDIEEELHRLGRLASTSLSARWSVEHAGSDLVVTGPQAVKCSGHWGTVRSVMPLPLEGITEWKICFNTTEKRHRDPAPSYTFLGVVSDKFSNFESSVFGAQSERRFAVGVDSFVDKARYGHVYAGEDEVVPEYFGSKAPVLNGVEIQVVANMDNNSLSFYDDAGERIARCWLPNSYSLSVPRSQRTRWYPAVSLRGDTLCTLRC